jgi:hypothetical protein
MVSAAREIPTRRLPTSSARQRGCMRKHVRGEKSPRKARRDEENRKSMQELSPARTSAPLNDSFRDSSPYGSLYSPMRTSFNPLHVAVRPLAVL